MFKLVVLSVVVAVAVAEPSLVAPLWGGHWGAAWGAAPFAVAPIGAANYRGPLSLAPGQPANILAADGRPLDTLDVNVDRAVHYTAKALNGAHLLKKRSVLAPLVAAPAVWPGVAAAHVVAHAPVVAAAPVAALGWGGLARWGHGW